MRRLLLIALTLTLTMTVLPNALWSAENPKVFKLGFISGLTGVSAAVVETQRKGVLLAAEEINAKGGLNMPWGKVKVEVLIKDDETKLDVGVRRFRELIAEGANAVTGTLWAPMAAALNEECKISSVPYFPCGVMAFDAYKKGNLAEGTFSVAFSPWSIGYLSGACMSKILGKKKIYHISRSDAWGTYMRVGLAQALKEYGGEVVGLSESPQGTLDYTSFINKAKTLKPDVFFTDFFSGDAIASIKQAHELGLNKMCTIFNAFITNVVAEGIPESALSGLYALTYYYYNLGNFEDKALIKRAKEYTDAHMKRWGEPPDAYGAFAYISMEMLFKGVEKAGSFDTKKFSQALLQAKDLATVKGPVYFREDHSMVSKYACFLVKGKGPSEKKDKADLFKVEGYFGGESALPPLKLLGY
jgi:branched-chain amino acid transport system substrate-binding protein